MKKENHTVLSRGISLTGLARLLKIIPMGASLFLVLPNVDPGSSRDHHWPIKMDSTRDTITPPIYAIDLRYGMDTSVSPCHDFYGFVNNGWRSEAVLPVRKKGEHGMQMVTMFSHVNRSLEKRLTFILDSARTVYSTTDDPTLKALGEFYESCMVADTLESPLVPRFNKDTMEKEPSRQEQCLSRVRAQLGSAAGQYFAEQLIRNGSVERMEQLLASLKEQVISILKENQLMTPQERVAAIERVQRLVLRVGIPDDRIDYTLLELDPNDYHRNKVTILNFFNSQWVSEIGSDVREKWKLSLLTPNAVYMPYDHAIEIPTLMFSPPFFYETGEDLRNFAGIGYVIGHEIFHSVTPQLRLMEDTRMNQEIEKFIEFNTSMGELDSWLANGRRTFNEDVADLGGGRVAYRAWQSVLTQEDKVIDSLVEGFTADQRFFIAMGRIWRSKWAGGAPNRDVHAPHFARVNATAMQVPEFSGAFACQEGDRMYLPPHELSKIW